MGEHTCTAPIQVTSFHSSFDPGLWPLASTQSLSKWASPPSALRLRTGTPAAALVNAAPIWVHAPQQATATATAAVPMGRRRDLHSRGADCAEADADIAGMSWNAYVEARALTPVLAAWRSRMAEAGIHPGADASALRKALRKKSTRAAGSGVAAPLTNYSRRGRPNSSTRPIAARASGSSSMAAAIPFAHETSAPSTECGTSNRTSSRGRATSLVTPALQPETAGRARRISARPAIVAPLSNEADDDDGIDTDTRASLPIKRASSRISARVAIAAPLSNDAGDDDGIDTNTPASLPTQRASSRISARVAVPAPLSNGAGDDDNGDDGDPGIHASLSTRRSSSRRIARVVSRSSPTSGAGSDDNDEGGATSHTLTTLPATHPGDEDDPALQAALSQVETLSAIRSDIHARFATAEVMGMRRSIAHKRTGNVASRLVKQAVVRPHADVELTAQMGSMSQSPGLESSSGVGGGCSSSSSMSGVTPEVLCRVAVYHATDSGRRSQEFVLLGTNTLDELKDRIYCVNDYVPGAIAHSPSLFAIEGVLYDDMRAGTTHSHATSATSTPHLTQPSPASSSGGGRAGGGVSSASWGASGGGSDTPVTAGAPGLLSLLMDDLDEMSGEASSPPPHTHTHSHAAATTYGGHERMSNRIVQWNRSQLASGKASGWGVLQSGSMQDTQMRTLKPRLGAHYLYRHQGSCEHFIVFMDVRLLSPVADAGVMNAKYYPRQVFQLRTTKQRCDGCLRAFAVLRVFGDKYADANPAYYCAACFGMLHCNAAGTLLHSDMTVESYMHD